MRGPPASKGVGQGSKSTHVGIALYLRVNLAEAGSQAFLGHNRGRGADFFALAIHRADEDLLALLAYV